VLGKFIWDSLITPAEAASPSGPILPGSTLLPSEEFAFGARSENAPGGPRPDTYPQLRRVSSAFPDIAPRNPDQPLPPPEPGPPLGIFSGKPMSEGLLPPSVWGPPDNSNASGDSDWFNLLAGPVSRNSMQPEPPQQTAGSMPERRLGRRILNSSPAPAYDPGAAAAPLAPSVAANYSGGLLGRLAAVAGIDPNQPAPPSPDDEQAQADIRALDAGFSSSGNIRDAVALYNARRSNRR
jgi:hypothetical protein